MKSLFEDRAKLETKPAKPRDEEEELLDELDKETKELLDTVKRQQAQLEDSVKLVKDVSKRVEVKINQVEDLTERADIEGSRSSSFCSLF